MTKEPNVTTPKKPPAKKPAARKPRQPGPSRPAKLRLVKVIVQPVCVVDHGTHMDELEMKAVAVSARDWPTYSSERFPLELAQVEHDLLGPAEQ